MQKKIISRLLCSVVISTLAIANADASVVLLAKGELDGSRADLSTKTAGLLENGLAGNLLGGVGSGFAWAGGNTFLATPDRGPNASAYNPLVDDTTSYISRFQSITMGLSKNAIGSALPYSLTPTLSATTLLSSQSVLNYGSGALGTGIVNGQSFHLGSGVPTLNQLDHTNYFTGRSDNFDASKNSINPNNARLDPEAIRVSNDGRSVFISDEYGPYVYQFDRMTGARIKSFALPGNLAISNLSSQSAVEIATNKTGRVTNKGMEGLSITPDGKTLVGIMQAALGQDKKGSLRIVTIDIATGATHEYAYKLTTGSGVSEIVALNDHQFLVDERDGSGLGDGTNAVIKQIYLIDLNGAQDVTAMSGDLSSKAVSKTLFVDLVQILKTNGVSANNIPAKIEGIAFGEDIIVDGVINHTLYVTNDNDFVAGVAGNNQFFVFGFTDTDLAAIGASYKAQEIVNLPEPTTYLMMFGGLGLIALRRRQDK